ncbi:MAG: ATP-dependent DNA ligase [Candidatus Hadarchaeum sp.]|uniref:ATP-dependent DNA ligase n=1 Tax=Candidatus Hadarchaeum sp. TaxID=2883567 RepID=UPI003D0C7066
MEYLKLAEVFERLEKTPSYLEKNAIIAELLRQTPAEEIERVVLLLLGRTTPAYVSQESGVGLAQLKKAVSNASGYSLSEVERLMLEIGDLGEVARRLMEKKKQVTLFTERLTVKRVFEGIRRLPEITGEGSVDRKILAISELLTSSQPLEAKFIIRTVLGDLRIGVAEGRLRDAIATAFNVDPEEVEHAYMLTTDYSLVARAAAEGGAKGLRRLGVIVGHPVNPMLAQRAEDIQEILERMKGKAAFEIKLDGIRIQVHKDVERIYLFTRRMENYTDMFPDLLPPLLKALKPSRVIVDGELVALDKKTGKPMPFQEVLKRRRKYGVEKSAEAIPVEYNIFDVLLVENRMMLDEPYTKRREMLEKIVEEVEGRVRLVEQRILSDAKEIQEFCDYAIRIGHEGLVAKDLQSTYRAGRREFLWLKLKPTLETLDLVVVGGLFGKGKRAGVFGSYVLAARDSETGRFKTVTKCGSGYTDEDLVELTKMFKKLQIKEPHEDVEIEIDCDAYFRPEVVFEVAYEEIQVSPEEKHTSGMGLRFPRFLRVREDRRPEEATTVQEIEELFELQERRKGKRA